jgi:hypothetical protein
MWNTVSRAILDRFKDVAENGFFGVRSFHLQDLEWFIHRSLWMLASQD